MRAIIRFATVVSVCLMAQGCISSLFDNIFSGVVTEKKVPESKAKFHINGEEFYRDSRFVLPFVAVHRKDFEFYEDEQGRAVLYASIRSIDQDGTPGGITGTIYFILSKTLVFQGCPVTEVESVRVELSDLYPKYHIVIDSFTVSFPEFTGYESGSPVRIEFSFSGGAYEPFLPEGETKYQYRLVKELKCTDGVFQEKATPPIQ